MKLTEFFQKYNKVAVAFSGGVDSSYLLYEAKKNGADVIAYYVKSSFQPEFEYNDAVKIAKQLGAEMKTIKLNVLSDKNITSNPCNRCYYCKKMIFGSIIKVAKADGYTVILDGTNASDNESARPGMKALKELSILSPLRICSLSKSDIRSLSENAGLFTWNKSAYACLATRIPQNEEITADKLKITEETEDFLFSLGFSDFRVRYFHGAARIQITEKDIPLFITQRRSIKKKLSEYYNGVFLDSEVRK